MVLFTVNGLHCSNVNFLSVKISQLEIAIKLTLLTMNKWLFYHNGLAITSLSTTANSKCFEEFELFFYSVPGVFSQSLPNT